MKALILAICCVAIGSIGTYAYLQNNPEIIIREEGYSENTTDEETHPHDENGNHIDEDGNPTEINYKDLIILESPLPNDVISSPVTIKGMARGNWFFEASFPVILTNWDGLIIAEAPAQAKGEWMTTEYVPFEVTLEFPEQTSGSRGHLILQKDNPSGLPEHDDALEIIVFYK